MKFENEFITEVCKFINPSSEKLGALMQRSLDYPYILGHLLYNRVGGAAFYTLQKCGLLEKTNREFRNTLRQIFISGYRKSESFCIYLNTLSAMLKNVSFPYAVLKGGYLASQYPKGLRTSNDVDFLVGQTHITDLADLLKANGFQQGELKNDTFVAASRAEILKSRMNRGETIPFVKKIDLPELEYCEIDINFSLDYKAKQNKELVSALLRNAEPRIHTENGTLRTLSNTDFIIHLCVHLFKEATVINWVNMGRDLSLYKFMDLYMLLISETGTDFYRSLLAAIKALNLERECYYALLYTKTLFAIKSIPLKRLLLQIKPENTAYMDEIIDPVNRKTYAYTLNLNDRIFCGARKEFLHEITYA